MNILLIAGHGGDDPGACAFGRQEAELAREFVTLLQREILRYKCDCGVYNMSLSAYHEIITLGKSYNFKPYDYVLEVHFNAYKKDSGDGKTKGSEIYVTTSEKSVNVETKIMQAFSSLGFTNRGIKRTDFAVIAKAKAQGVSSALLETCFIDDTDDMALYLSKKGALAKEVARAIATEYGLTIKEEPKMAKFKDVDKHWARADIEFLYQQGIINGYADGTFRPDRNITRAEVAAMMAKLLRKYKG